MRAICKYYYILYTGLEHPPILVSEGVLEPIPVETEGWLYLKMRELSIWPGDISEFRVLLHALCGLSFVPLLLWLLVVLNFASHSTGLWVQLLTCYKELTKQKRGPVFSFWGWRLVGWKAGPFFAPTGPSCGGVLSLTAHQLLLL